MPYFVEVRPAAERDLKALPRNIFLKVISMIDSLAENPYQPCVEKPSGSKNSYRVRVGDYRILYQIHKKVLLVVVVRVRHRREVYR